MTLSTRTCQVKVADVDMTASYTYIPYLPATKRAEAEGGEVDISAITFHDTNLLDVLDDITITSIEDQIYDFETNNNDLD